jgi:AcrR family transcriptional regulator
VFFLINPKKRVAVKKFNVEEKILKKSVDLFFKHGFVKASIRDIVRAVDISNSTVYIYFKNKDEILYKIIVDVGSDLLKELQDVIEQNNDPVGCLREMIFKQICFSLDKYKKMKIYLEEQYQLPPYLRKRALKQHRQIYDLYFGKISELEEKDLLYSADKTVITFGIFAMMNWIYRWFNPNGRLSIEEVARETTDMFFRGNLKMEREPGVTFNNHLNKEGN